MVAVLFLLSMNSCDMIGGNDESDLYGTWSIDGISVDVTVDGTDIVEVMVNNFDYDPAVAEAMLDTLVWELEDDISGTLTFNEDMTYTINVSDDSPETGTWTLSEDGSTLTLVDSDMDSDVLMISKLTASSLIIKLQDEDEDVDLDGDDQEESTMIISVEVTLSKN